ncbi:MAG: hypothetical protein B6D68_02465 [spirochete symbiont of Stewartia floridana]|nr:MAG: hypothetical protein B6D68_02465 [spirochete symbiont of Stewartia floridana]
MALPEHFDNAVTAFLLRRQAEKLESRTWRGFSEAPYSYLPLAIDVTAIFPASGRFARTRIRFRQAPC